MRGTVEGVVELVELEVLPHHLPHRRPGLHARRPLTPPRAVLARVEKRALRVGGAGCYGGAALGRPTSVSEPTGGPFGAPCMPRGCSFTAVNTEARSCRVAGS